VHDVVTVAVARARGGGGPTVVEALTYRHFGHRRTDPATYRPAAEVVAAGVRRAQAAPAADPADAYTDVWADGSWSWRT
jgi:pyruvate dehydrogenase E1 component alpha subunit